MLQPNQVFGGVGYSLGAIVLNNYVANYGDQVELDVSVAISGALNTLFQKDFVRSGWTWQPMIAAHMKDVFFAGKWGQRVRHQLGKQKYQELLRATNVVVSCFCRQIRISKLFDCIQYSCPQRALLFHFIKGRRSLRWCRVQRLRFPDRFLLGHECFATQQD